MVKMHFNFLPVGVMKAMQIPKMLNKGRNKITLMK